MDKKTLEKLKQNKQIINYKIINKNHFSIMPIKILKELTNGKKNHIKTSNNE